jgi:hypothetical protein
LTRDGGLTFVAPGPAGIMLARVCAALALALTSPERKRRLARMSVAPATRFA